MQIILAKLPEGVDVMDRRCWKSQQDQQMMDRFIIYIVGI